MTFRPNTVLEPSTKTDLPLPKVNERATGLGSKRIDTLLLDFTTLTNNTHDTNRHNISLTSSN